MFCIFKLRHLCYHDIQDPERSSFRTYIGDFGRETKCSGIALILPVITLGGVHSGIFTPTEATAVCIAYATFAIFLTGNLNLRNAGVAIIKRAAVRSLERSGDRHCRKWWDRPTIPSLPDTSRRSFSLPASPTWRTSFREFIWVLVRPGRTGPAFSVRRAIRSNPDCPEILK